ncbi:MAG: hypothetical protein AAF437_00925 [Pseudomonadota bacterium]
MKKRDLPNEPLPLSPWGYWRASVQTWVDFSQRTGQIMMSQISSPNQRAQATDSNAETLASELLRTLSDMNLRHWQNTARLLESYPTWMNLPHSMAGSALVDWYDKLQRQPGGLLANTAQSVAALKTDQRPQTLAALYGKADDLTRIKGIGPKLSRRLNEIGVFHFKQIANWSASEALWIDDHLASKGRVAREAWIKQARLLTANGSNTLH